MSDPATGDAETLADDGHVLRALGERVRAARVARRMPRRELAEISGVSARYLAQLEAGTGNISVRLLSRVAAALELTLAQLFADGRPREGEAEVLRAWRAAGRVARSHALDRLHLSVERAERICLIGLRGAGKSTLGRQVGEMLNLPFVELNTEVEAAAGMPLGEIMAMMGPETYRVLEKEALQAVTERHNRVILAVAGGIVSDAETYDGLLSRYHTVWLRASPEEHMARVRAQGDMRPMEGMPQAMLKLRGILATRQQDYSRAASELDTSGAPVGRSARDLVELIRERGFLRDM